MCQNEEKLTSAWGKPGSVLGMNDADKFMLPKGWYIVWPVKPGIDGIKE